MHSLYEPVHGIRTFRISTKASNNRLFWLVQRNQMPKSCLESSSTFILCICEARPYKCTGSLEPTPHANVRRSNISCADQFTKHTPPTLINIVKQWYGASCSFQSLIVFRSVLLEEA